MRIKPDKENIGRKEQNGSKRNKKSYQSHEKIKTEIDLQFGFLAHQAIQL
jgi:hypothetical protein